MRIAFFADNFYPELSGISDSIILTGTELARRGHEVDYFVPAYSRKNYETGGVEYRELELGPNVAIHRLFSFPFAAPTGQGRAVIPNVLRGIFSRRTFDVLHSHSFFGPGLDALCLSKMHNIPLVGTNHTLVESFTRYSPIKSEWLEGALPRYVVWYYNHCDLAATPTEFLLRDMQAKGLQVRGQAMSNPIEPPFFRPRATKDALKKELGLSAFTVLYVGRISSEKSPEVLLEAFISFAEDVPNAGLVIIGQGATRAVLEKRADASRASSRITITGPFMGEKKQTLYDYFHASDVFVMPSTSETQSVSTLQAMAGGMPIVVAEAAALPGLAAEGRGFLFRPGDTGALRSHLTRLYAEPKLRDEASRRGLLFARAYSVQEIADRWEKLYADVIKRHAAKL